MPELIFKSNIRIVPLFTYMVYARKGEMQG